MHSFPVKRLGLILLTLAAFSMSARADDVEDVKGAFNRLVEYQKNDDARTLDLFAPDVAVTFTLTDGKTSKSTTVPPEVFREIVTRSLAEKKGSQDAYEEVKYTPQGDGTVRVTCTLLYAESGNRGPFEAVYGKDASGQFKIKVLKATLPVDQMPGGN